MIKKKKNYIVKTDLLKLTQLIVHYSISIPFFIVFGASLNILNFPIIKSLSTNLAPFSRFALPF